MRFSTLVRRPESELMDSSSPTKTARKSLENQTMTYSPNIENCLTINSVFGTRLRLFDCFEKCLYSSLCRTESLSRSYEEQDLTLTLPEGKTIKEIRWLAVWSRAFGVSQQAFSIVVHSNWARLVSHDLQINIYNIINYIFFPLLT